MRTLLLGILISLILPLSAYAIKFTPEQMQAFSKLSPAEKQRLARTAGYNIDIQGQAQLKQPAAPGVMAPRVDRKPKNTGGNKNITDHELPPNNVLSDDAQPEQSDGFDEDSEPAEHASDILKPFGYALFSGEPITFEPATYVPISQDYVIGPGDTVIVQLYGKENAIHELQVTREGRIDFPNVGPISINGLDFSDLKARINQLVEKQMIGVKASVSMGALRSMQIFVLGEAYKPGAYTVSALSTMTHALFVSGGVNELASLRDIQLKRNGKIVTRLDLYDLLMGGDTSNDLRLQPADVVFIPPYKYTAGVRGEIKRPAIYEFHRPTSVIELLEMAGGLTAEAYPGSVQIERINENAERTLINVDLRNASDLKLVNGDTLTIGSVLDQVEDSVLVEGHVDRPGGFKWASGMRVSDIVSRLSDLKPNPNTQFALVNRKNPEDGSISVLHFSPSKALFAKGSAHDVLLAPRDNLVFFGNADNPANALSDLVNQLAAQARLSEYPRTVSVKGHVKFPGQFPLTTKMDVETLINAAGGLKPDADFEYAFLIKKDQANGLLKPVWINLRNEPHAGIHLTPLDELYLFGKGTDRQALLAPLVERLENQSDNQRAAKLVSISGAVKYPGVYPLVDNMSVETLVAFSGGYEETAYSLTAEVTRKEVGEAQNFLVKHIKVSLSSDGSANGVLLTSRDRLVIKKISKWNQVKSVSLKGELQFPGTYPIIEGETLSQLIVRAGGLTAHADPYGAIFLRESLRQREEKVLAQFGEELNKQLVDIEKQALGDDSEISEAKLAGVSLLKDLDAAEATGRLVINLPEILANNPQADVVLRDGDDIVVPSMIQEVSVLGEVQYPTSHLYREGLTGRTYLNLSGGYSVLGDQRRAYVIERNGSVEPLKRRYFLFFSRQKPIKPGDSIVVPPDLDRVAPLTYWAQISQILFQLSTTAAALNTVGAF